MSTPDLSSLSIKSLQDFLLKTYVVNEVSYVSRGLKSKT